MNDLYPKIVSLLPAATEIAYALGLEKNLVGRSHECDFPAAVKQLPVCSEANFPDNLSSGDIDIKVKEILADALSVYTVKRVQIKQLAPDVVITQAQCEVCAVSLKEVEEALDEAALDIALGGWRTQIADWRGSQTGTAIRGGD